MSENGRARKRRKGKKWKKILAGILIPFLIMGGLFFGVFLFFTAILPSAEDEQLAGYKAAAELAGCTWQELLVYDTVRFENDLENVNPGISAVDFLKLHYEQWIWVSTVHGGHWELEQQGDLTTTESICNWLHMSVESEVQAVLDKGKEIVSSGGNGVRWVIDFSSKELDDLIIEKGFDNDQIEWVDLLMTSGILEEMYEDIYDLPEYIGSAGSGYFGWPTPELHTITSKFSAARKHPVLGITRAHNGVDISGANSMGSPVVAIDDGVVLQVNMKGGERGINIRVQHTVDGDVWVSRYQHLSAVKVSAGQKVKKGTVIGAVGNTGIGTGPHLHLELTYNGVLIDPLPLIQ